MRTVFIRHGGNVVSHPRFRTTPVVELPDPLPAVLAQYDLSIQKQKAARSQGDGDHVDELSFRKGLLAGVVPFVEAMASQVAGRAVDAHAATVQDFLDHKIPADALIKTVIDQDAPPQRSI